MTRKLTREERVQALYDLKVGQVLSMADIENVKMLSRMALAAMDSEPVAVVEPSDYVTAAQLVGEGPARKAVHELYEGALRIGDKLYRHAQPATASEPLAVTDDELNAALQLHRLKVDGHSQLSDAFRAGFRYARRTTPQPAPHDTPALNSVQSVVTVSDTWIPVSERMPAPDSQLRVCAYTPTPHEDIRYRFVPASLFKAVCTDATHWHYMEPPAAPQEVKGE